MMSSSERRPSTSLDESLTNMQWLCKLDSNPLLETQKANETITAEPTSMNPHPKPPYSYATLILLAINSTQEKRMTLQDIYKWIEDNFPYYKNCKKAWKNSIRHNLSLHSFFLKAQRPSSLPGKGSYWCISPEGKENIMKEVMKHQQPLMNQPVTTDQSNTKGLRPILPKPADDLPMSSSPFLNKGGVQIITDGSLSGLPGSIPVVILPTQIYMNMANKIAAQAAIGNMAAVAINPSYVPVTTETSIGESNTEAVQVQGSQGLGEESESSLSGTISVKEEVESGCSPSLTQIEQKLFSKSSALTLTVEQALCNIEDRKNEIISNGGTTSKSTSSRKTYKSPSLREVKIENEMLDPHAKKTRTDKRKTKPGNRIKTSTPSLQKRQNLPQPKRSPLRPRPQPTLAAINSQANEMISPGPIFNYRNNTSDITCLSPVKPMITPTKACTNQSFLASLLVSPLNCGSGHLGFTPASHGSDSGFFTPLKEGEFDYGFLLSPERFSISKACSTPQSCRKSLGLGLAYRAEDKKVDAQCRGYDMDFTKL